MESFLRRIKLIDDFSVTINIDRVTFINALSRNVDFADIDSVFSSAFEVFSSSKNNYKGRIDNSGFKIRKRRRLFEPNFGFAKATGVFIEINNNLRIETKVNAWNNLMYLYFGFISIIYFVFFGAFISDIQSSEMPIFVPFFILVHAFFMFGIPYFIMRRNVRRTKTELEREFVYIINKDLIVR